MAKLLMADTGTIDDDTNFEGYVISRAIPPGGAIAQLGEVGNPAMLIAKPSTGVTVRATVIRDHGLEVATSDILLTPGGLETRVVRQFEAMNGADIGRLQIKLGDTRAIQSTWSLDYLHVVVIEEGAR